MNRILILTVGFILFILLLLPISLTFLIRLVPAEIQPSLGNTKKIYGDFVLTQSFISTKDNLAGIGVSIKNPNLANKKKATVNILDDQDRIIRSVDLNGRNIADGKFVKIIFDPIKDSKNRKFSWSIASLESSFDDAMEIFLTNEQPTWSLDLKVNNKIVDQTFSYVTLHKPSSKVEVLDTIFKELLDKIKGDISFFLVYFFILLLLIIFIFARSPLENLKKTF